MTYIKKIEITSFGKLCDYTLEFNSGLNEIILPNESGKSTMADFILFMLYGFTKTSKKTVALEDNLLKKYLPWSDIGYIAGAMTVVKDGAEYRIERRHQQSKTVSSAILRDPLGRELPLEKEPGEMLFGVDRDTFMRTFFVRQTDIKFKSTDGIVTALKNLVTTGDEDMSYDSARAALETERKKYQHIGRRSGRVYDIQKELQTLETDIRVLENEIGALAYNMKELETFKMELSRLDNEYQSLEAKRGDAEAFDARAKLAALAEIEREYQSLQEKCKNHDFTKEIEGDIKTADAVFSERELLLRRKSELENEKQTLMQKLTLLKSGITDFEYISTHTAELENALADKGKPRLELTAAGVVLAIIGTVLAFILHPALWALTGVGVIVAVLGLVIKVKPRVDESALSSLSLYKTRRPEIELTEALCRENEARLDSLEKEIATNNGKREMIAQSLNVRDKSELTELTTLYNNVGIIKTRLEELEAKKNEVLGEDTVDALRESAQNGGDIGFGKAKLSQMLADASNRRAALKLRIVSLSEDEGRAATLEREILEKKERTDALNTELKHATYRVRVLDLALETLNEAYDEISRMFSPRLTEKARAPLSLLTDGKYSDVYLDSDFIIRVKADGELKELGYFSRGTVDAVYFAVRRAVSELIANENSVPLVMDDPFWSLDDDRLQKAREYVKKLSENMQIIVFSARK